MDKTISKESVIVRKNTSIYIITLVTLGIVLLTWPPIFNNTYFQHIAVTLLVGVIAALGYNLFFGYMGQVLFGPVAFYGIGAYTTAMLEGKVGAAWVPAVIAAPIVAGIAAIILSWPILRLKGHGMALGTFGFAYFAYLVIERWATFTNGNNGIYVKPPTFFGIDLRNGIGYYYVVLIVAVLVFLLCYFIMKSKHGRAIKAIRADEIGAAAMGVNVGSYKRNIWVLCAMILGLAGGLISQQATVMAPDYAGVPQNMLLILMVIIGGLRSDIGMVIGGIFVSLLPILLADLAQYAVVIYSAIFILVIRFMPEGIIGLIRRLAKLPAIE